MKFIKYKLPTPAAFFAVVIPMLMHQSYAQSVPDHRQINQLIKTGRPDTSTLGRLYRIGDALLYKPGSDSADITAAHDIAGQLEMLGKKTGDSLAMGLSHLLTAKIFRELGRAKAGRPASEQALRLLQTYGTDDLKAQAVIELGGSYSNEMKDLPRKIDLYKQAVAIYHAMGRKLDEARMEEFVGDLLMLNEQYADAQIILQKGLALYKAVNYERLHGIYSLLATAHHFQYHFDEAFRYNLLAISTAEKLEEKSPLLATIYNRVGMIYAGVDYFSDAINYFNKSLVISRLNSDTASVRHVLLNIANMLNWSGHYAASKDTLVVLSKLGKFDGNLANIKVEILSLSDCMRLKGYCNETPHLNNLLHYLRSRESSEEEKQLIRIHLGGYFQYRGLMKDCARYVKEAFYLHKTIPIPATSRPLAERLAYQIDSANHNMDGAFEHAKQYKIWFDSLERGSHSRQISLLQVQFETQQKDKDIQLLHQKAAFQEASLDRERLYRSIFIAGVIALAVFVGLIYNRYLIKRKVARKLEEKQGEINRQNEKLTRLLGEKEWLLKEVHHRVKNNLQIVISLLNTQTKHLESEDAIGAIRNSQQRMYSMSLIHQRLYQTDNVGRIDMQWYVTELTKYLKDSLDIDDRVKFIKDLDDVSFVVVQAVPIGLIINEAVSNAIKYAFPHGRKGVVRISFKRLANHYAELTIADNGVGIPDMEGVIASGSLGMSLIYGLADQLDGGITVHSNEGGLIITITFPISTIIDEPLIT